MHFNDKTLIYIKTNHKTILIICLNFKRILVNIKEPIKKYFLRPIKFFEICKRIKFFGFKRYCTVCNSNVSIFLPFNKLNPREDAQCPICLSLERHRLVIVFLKQQTSLFNNQKKEFLHIAPEKGFIKSFASAAKEGYLTADLMDKTVMEKMDITDIHHTDNTFDIIYCSHVLEHVDDDRKAIREFYRTLKIGGWAILNVPITEEITFEDPTVTDPKERERLFRQDDHVRCYGPDYIDRLKEVGFNVTVITPKDLFDKKEILKYGVSNGAGEIFYCVK